MRLLLDTHVVIWLWENNPRLPERVQEAIVGSTELFVSLASAWEHEIRRAKFPNRDILPFENMLDRSEITRLDLPFSVHKLLEDLPPIHADPFDRMLIAHARHLDCPLVTADAMIRKYPVETLW